jgi:DNA-binding LytR/AlgR family response regulator
MLEIAICDDNKDDLIYAGNLLREILPIDGKNFNLQLFSSATKMLCEIKQVDIAILDIAMEEMNGIDLGEKLKRRFPALKLIYMTSYEQYCMQAINVVHAFSFLCKPIEKNEIQEQIISLVDEMKKSTDAEKKTFEKVTDCRGKEYAAVKIRLNDIIYFEYIKSKRRILIVLENETYEYSYIMERLIAELNDFGFGVNCRGFLVNLRHIVKIKGYKIYLDNGKILQLSQKRAAKFKETMNDFIHEKM